jgi:hypothetical protein
LKLAYRIKNAILDSTDLYYTDLLQQIKVALPKSVQTLVWSPQTVIFNGAYPKEWFYSRRSAFTNPKRPVHTWINASKPDVQAPWIFSSENEGDTFTIKNVWNDEYVYPDSSTLDNNNERRFVYTWTDKTVGYWEVEVLSDDSITLKSYDYKEYLYAEVSAYRYDNSRRSVFTAVSSSGHVCDDSCTWIIANECKSSQII